MGTGRQAHRPVGDRLGRDRLVDGRLRVADRGRRAHGGRQWRRQRTRLPALLAGRRHRGTDAGHHPGRVQHGQRAGRGRRCRGGRNRPGRADPGSKRGRRGRVGSDRDAPAGRQRGDRWRRDRGWRTGQRGDPHARRRVERDGVHPGHGELRRGGRGRSGPRGRRGAGRADGPIVRPQRQRRRRLGRNRRVDRCGGVRPGRGAGRGPAVRGYGRHPGHLPAQRMGSRSVGPGRDQLLRRRDHAFSPRGVARHQPRGSGSNSRAQPRGPGRVGTGEDTDRRARLRGLDQPARRRTGRRDRGADGPGQRVGVPTQRVRTERLGAGRRQHRVRRRRGPRVRVGRPGDGRLPAGRSAGARSAVRVRSGAAEDRRGGGGRGHLRDRRGQDPDGGRARGPGKRLRQRAPVRHAEDGAAERVGAASGRRLLRLCADGRGGRGRHLAVRGHHRGRRSERGDRDDPDPGGQSAAHGQ